MPELMPGPVVIPVPGGKTIEEFVGMVATGDDSVSIAHMVAPAGWEEPAQTPEFDEFTIVLEGSMTVETDDGPMIVSAGQAVITRAGETVRYSTPDGARYIAVCVPAFTLEGAHRHDQDIDPD
ncbi:MAG: cupin domain-containing protein [Actinobacteria bacterium]|nr:cupin domain-containing protein [Actinomycetota bacterium]